MIIRNRINARQPVRLNKIKRSYLLRSSIADFSRALVTLSTPNGETLKVFADTDSGKNLFEHKNIDEMHDCIME